jgi:hypothetical protein
VRRLPTPRIAISRPAAALCAALLVALCAALLIALCAAAPAGARTTVNASASASSVNKIFEDCGESKIPTGFSQQAYDQALKQMPAELAEYDDCPALIHKAQRAAAGGHGGSEAGGPGGGAAAAIAPPTASEQRTLEHVRHSGGAPVKVGEEVVHPGVVHVDIASAVGKLPTPLLALLAFLLACALLILGRGILARVRARRGGA